MCFCWKKRKNVKQIKIVLFYYRLDIFEFKVFLVFYCFYEFVYLFFQNLKFFMCRVEQVVRSVSFLRFLGRNNEKYKKVKFLFNGMQKVQGKWFFKFSLLGIEELKEFCMLTIVMVVESMYGFFLFFILLGEEFCLVQQVKVSYVVSIIRRYICSTC